MSGHDCPLCRSGGVLYRHATCGRCWQAVPGRIQRRLTRTWPRRVEDPSAHHEAMAELLGWAREAGAVNPR